jgi:hypothetical protein
MEKYTHSLTSHQRGGRGEVRRWTHDMRMNGLSKSGPKPCRSTVSFAVYFYYELVSNTCLIERDLVGYGML